MGIRTIIINCIALSIWVTGFVFNAVCQTIILPHHGTGDTTMSYAVVYDDGGATGPYSSSCNVVYTFHTVSPNGCYRIEVESQLTHPQGNASLTIRNGGSTGSVICSSPPGGGVFESSGNTVTIVFRADDDNPTQGFKVILCEFEQYKPTNIESEYLDNNTLKITWEEPNTGVVWVFDYAVVPESTVVAGYFDNSSNPRTTLQLTEPEYTIYNIPIGDKVVYRLLSQGASGCYSMLEGVVPPYEPHNECPCVKPEIVSIEPLPDSVRITWTTDSEVSLWHVFSADDRLDTFLVGSARVLTIPYEYPCRASLLFINGNCRDTICNTQFIELPRGGCSRNVGMLRRERTDGHSISLSWNATSNSLDRYVLYARRSIYPADSNLLVDTFSHNTTSCEVEGLLPHTGYHFTMILLCEGGTPACDPVETEISTTIDGCIDFINFFDGQVHMTCGTYDNPLRDISNGYELRHIAIIDSSSRDALTGGELRQVPPGEEVSFRLGDENVGAQGETVTFDFMVDTLDKDMLLVKYAVVLQNPNHNSSNQPHFTLEILDNNGTVIDTECCYADFFAAGGLAGWNSVPGTNVIWKDWTNVGIDISSYHGQQLHVRFTTKDCADGGHFGYAYFTIACDNRRIALVNLCDSRDSVRLRAPEGFDYVWERVGDSAVIATTNEIMVPVDSAEYLCHCTFLGKAACGFTVHALALLPQPKAGIGCRIDTCGQKVYLYNQCRIDIDSAYLHLVRQRLVDMVWSIDGHAMIGDTLVLPIDGNGSHSVRISCRLSESSCTDSASLSYFIDCYHRQAIEGPTDVCRGDEVTLLAMLDPADQFRYSWEDGEIALSRRFVVENDTSISLITRFLQCVDTTTHQIIVHPQYDDTVALAICQGVYDTLGFSIGRDTQQGYYSNSGYSRYGCDSMFTINLSVSPSYYDTLRVVTCDEPYSDMEFTAESTGIYTHAYTTVEGCDSLYVLDLLRHQLTVDTFVAEIVHGDIYHQNGFMESQAGFFDKVFVDRYGCDSTLRLDLHVVALRFPNVVTPNGDGKNDLWGIVGLLDAREFEYSVFWIYDRWGRLICKQENIHETEQFWNPDKTDTPEGTYFFRFYARHSTGREIEHKGVIEVVR